MEMQQHQELSHSDKARPYPHSQTNKGGLGWRRAAFEILMEAADHGVAIAA